MSDVRIQLRQRHRSEWRQTHGGIDTRIRTVRVDFNKRVEQRAARPCLCAHSLLAHGGRHLSFDTQREGTARVDAAIERDAARSVLKRAALDHDLIGVGSHARREVADHAGCLAACAKP